ncbi:MAG TPA: hypothetical protein VGR90_08375 [Acidimicrobiales bacterium]|nr:hypothetical protein [Acidimicrobiales bacterium]
MYDYTDGKIDWMSYGLDVEGEEGPFVTEVLDEIPTVRWDRTVGYARAQLSIADLEGDHDHSDHDAGRPGLDRALAVVLGPGALAIGSIDEETFAHANDAELVVDVMNLVPSTVRPSITVAQLMEGKDHHALVTSSDGVWMGEADADRDQIDQLMADVEERFGTSEPSPEQLMSFLRERLIADGRTPEEADQFLAHMDEDDAD